MPREDQHAMDTLWDVLLEQCRLVSLMHGIETKRAQLQHAHRQLLQEMQLSQWRLGIGMISQDALWDVHKEQSRLVFLMIELYRDQGQLQLGQLLEQMQHSQWRLVTMISSVVEQQQQQEQERTKTRNTQNIKYI